MALIKCGECGNDISDHATTCPNCGNPINPINHTTDETANEKTQTTKTPTETQTPTQTTEKHKEGGTWAIGKLAIGIISLFLFFIIGLQSCAATFSNALTNDGSTSGLS